MNNNDVTRTDRDSFGMNGLANAPAFPGTPEFSRHIEAQEARGQKELVNSTQFPSRAPIERLEALGFVFGPVNERDPLFRTAQLPDGWAREGSDHSMWSYIVDAKGRRRVSIFYKAAYYDRDAFASMVHPTTQLSDLIFGEGKIPKALDLGDDFLSTSAAHDYLIEQRTETKEKIARYEEGDNYMKSLVPELNTRLHRITRLIALLP